MLHHDFEAALAKREAAEDFCAPSGSACGCSQFLVGAMVVYDRLKVTKGLVDPPQVGQRAAEVIVRQSAELRGQIRRVKDTIQGIKTFIVLPVLQGEDAEL